MKYYILIIGMMLLLNGCYKVGYQDFVDIENDMIGGKVMNYKPLKYKNAGKPRRGR